ncbi:MAG: hypothetical protein HOP02_07205 [Methylococcaceae bacterium]|nr:hypothetical protein [Methylococcaceae bacterium]
MSHYSWEYKITLLCAACSLILCLLLGGEALYGKHYRGELLKEIFTVKKAGFEMKPVPAYPFPQGAVEQYADFVARPVVFEGRKPIAKIVEPVAAVAEVPKAPVGEFGLTLTGIVKTPKGGIKALFQNPAGKTPSEKNKRLAQGEEFNGWKLIDIQTDKISIQAGSETKEIKLLKAKPKTARIAGNINPFAAPNFNSAPNMPPPNMQPPPNVPPPNANPFNLKP